MKARSFRFFCLTLLGSVAANCHLFGAAHETPEPELTKDIAIELAEIKRAYQAPPCYSASFTFSAKTPGKSSQSAGGTILADNKHERLRMEIKVPYIGILISRMIVQDGTVYLNDVYNKKKLQVPVEKFALGNLNQSSIPLPFYIFQDMLFARLPKRIYEGQARRTLRDQDLEVHWKDGYESFSYLFSSRMLRLMRYEYSRGSAQQIVETSLRGRYPGTGFPRSIHVLSGRPEASASQKSSMTLRFRSVNLKARCRDASFVP